MATLGRHPQKPKTSKSSLVSHTFPPFYACYLLKSIKNPKSTATYIGSTPHPPRRIRQHNGELTQGAWKTSQNRPWAMAMIVHGFPSKLAALQFEWAWQHPNRSRHLKGGDVTKGRTLKANIAVARSMLTTHPYTSWPLQVKLFTPEAVKGWTEACKNPTSLPIGFTYTVELEGVDGKGGHVGSGRIGPIDVTDKAFTSSHIAKHIGVLSKNEAHACMVCGKDLDLQKSDPLSLALCPTHDCMAYAHLTCLATSFLTPPSTTPSEASMVPRGGTCNACRHYVLWGDIIRGCYRRRTGGQGTAMEQSAIVEEAEQEEGDMDEVLQEEETEKRPRPRKGKAPAATKSSPQGKRKKIKVIPPEEEGEFFDLDAISGSDTTSSSDHGPKARAIKKAKPSPSKSKRKPDKSAQVAMAREYRISMESLDIDNFSSTDEDIARGRLKRPAKPSKRANSKTQKTTLVGLADALAGMHLQQSLDMDGPMAEPSFIQRKPTRIRAQGTKSRHEDEDVIEISD